MNLLYGILMGAQSIPAAYSWYYKNYTFGMYSQKIKELRASLMASADTEGSTAMVAACLCYMVLYTEFGAEIQKLDSNNTYNPPSRPDDADSSDVRYTMSRFIKPASEYGITIGLLDKDIQDRVDKQSFISIAGAICLQMLRELTR